MKRRLLNIVMAAFIGCFAACSEEEIISTQNGTPKEVTVTAQIPAGAATRNVGVDNVINDNQLRCILSVVNNQDKSEITRIEKPVGADDTKISFTFSVESGIDYSCLFWADYIDLNANEAEGKYADKYYNTANLQAISVKVDETEAANNVKLFNNTAADAFCGVLSKDMIADSEAPSIALKRPFAQLNLKPTADDKWKDQITTMDIEFNMPGEFNMLTGKAAGTKTTVKATGVTREADDALYFSTYLFIEDPTMPEPKFNSDIQIKFNVAESQTPVERTIKAGFTVKPNTEINGEANLSKEEDINVDVTIDGEKEDPNAPKVGQYLYADGTWGDTYNAEGEQKSIGIIFADAKDKTDNSEYGKDGMKIYGYAMALTNISTKRTNITEGELNLSNTINVNNAWFKDYNGFTYTKSLIENVGDGFNDWTQWNTSNPINANNLSQWYIPSACQLLEMTEITIGRNEAITYFNNAEINFPAITKNEKLAQAYLTAYQNQSNTWSGLFSTGANGSGLANIISSTACDAKNLYGIQLQRTTADPENKEQIPAETYNQIYRYAPSNVNIRPIITIFKAIN